MFHELEWSPSFHIDKRQIFPWGYDMFIPTYQLVNAGRIQTQLFGTLQPPALPLPSATPVGFVFHHLGAAKCTTWRHASISRALKIGTSWVLKYARQKLLGQWGFKRARRINNAKTAGPPWPNWIASLKAQKNQWRKDKESWLRGERWRASLRRDALCGRGNAWEGWVLGQWQQPT